MAQSYLLSIDQGTTGTTVSLINTKGQLKVKVNREFRQIFPKVGWVEHNPDDIWKSTVFGIRQVLKKAQISGGQVQAIGITNQRETLMAWDRQTGESLGNAIVWQCRRTTSLCEKLKKAGVEPHLKKVTGLVLDPYFSGTKMAWILKNHSKAKTLARKGQLCFGTVDSFLIWKLSGGKNHKTDVSNASRTQLMDLETLDYSSDMLKLMGVKRDMLPEIQASGSLFGKTARVAGLPSGVPITGVLGDQQSALFGQFCFNRGDAKITFGTGSFLLMNTGSKKVPSPSGLITTVGWQLPKSRKPVYALEGGAFICGAAVQWLRDSLSFVKKSSDIEGLAEKAKDSAGVQFVPAFAGLGAPFWNPHVQGTFFGLTRGTQKQHIARATLEAMALQNVDILSTMMKDSKIKLKTLRVDGGAAANKILMQMQADYLGIPVVRPQIIETTTYGAALMAGLGLGLWSSVNDLKKWDRVDQDFSVQMPKAQRSQRIRQWHQAIAATQSYYTP